MRGRTNDVTSAEQMRAGLRNINKFTDVSQQGTARSPSEEVESVRQQSQSEMVLTGQQKNGSCPPEQGVPSVSPSARPR